MALITCPECGRQVSSEAIACPECGYPIKDKAPVVEEKKQELKTKVSETVDQFVKKKKKKALIKTVIFVILCVIVYFCTKAKTEEVKETFHIGDEEGDRKLVVLKPTLAQIKAIYRKKKKFRKLKKQFLNLILGA